MSNPPEIKSRRTEGIETVGPANLKRFKFYTPQDAGRLSFFSLPAEIRNMIYEITLGVGKPCIPIQSDLKADPQLNSRSKLLTLCHLIGFEAGTLFLDKCLAYIPVNCAKRLGSISPVNIRRTFGHIHTTRLAALTDMRMAHIHLHVSMTNVYEGNSLFSNLHHAIKIWSNNSEPRYQNYGRRRAATVHLDHYFADDWKNEILQSRTLWPILVTMSKDKFTDWTISYYIHAGYESTTELRGAWHTARLEEFNDLERKCKLCGVHLKPEIYGDGNWEELDWPTRWTESVETEVTAPSTLWPMYPSNLHGEWRKQERRAFWRKT